MTVSDSDLGRKAPSLKIYTQTLAPNITLEAWIHTIATAIQKTQLIFKLMWTWIAEKAMAPHSSTLAWKIPWTEESGRLQSMGSLGVRHDWATSLSLFTFVHWRRKWQPTPVFLPGESQGWGSLVGCRLQGRTESDTTEATLQQQQQQCLKHLQMNLNTGLEVKKLTMAL